MHINFQDSEALSSQFDDYGPNWALTHKESLIKAQNYMSNKVASVAISMLCNNQYTKEERIEIAKLCAQKDGKITATYIERFGLVPQDDKRSLYDIAKLCAHQSGSASQFIKNFGLDPQKDKDQLIEIAKLAAQQDGVAVAKYIQEFGLNPVEDKQQLYDIAKLCAHQSGSASQFIKNFGLDPQKDKEQLIEIAKLSAQQDGVAAAKYIQEFGLNPLEDKQRLYEIATLCVNQSGRASEFIKNFHLDPQKDQLIEIAKLAAQRDGLAVAKYIQQFGLNPVEDKQQLYGIAILCVNQSARAFNFIKNFGLNFEENQKELLEIAKLGIKQDLFDSLKSIDQFILNPEDKEIRKFFFDVAQMCVERDASKTSQWISQFAFKEIVKSDEDKNIVFKIAKSCASANGEATAANIWQFGFNSKEDKNMLFEIAKECAKQNPEATIKSLHMFRLLELQRFHIAMLCAERNGSNTAKSIKVFSLQDPKQKLEIFKACVKQDLYALDNIDHFEFDLTNLETKQELINIAKLYAEQNGECIASRIIKLQLSYENDKESLLDIAKKCARENGRGTAIYIKNFGFEKRDCFEIAKLCIQQNTAGTLEFFSKFGFSSETDTKELSEIAKLAAEQDGAATARWVVLFDFDPNKRAGDKAILIEIARLCAQNSPYGIAEDIKKFSLNSLDDQVTLIELAKLSARKDPNATDTHIENFGIQNQQEILEIRCLCFLEIYSRGENLKELKSRITSTLAPHSSILSRDFKNVEQSLGGMLFDIHQVLYYLKTKKVMDKERLLILEKLCAYRNHSLAAHLSNVFSTICLNDNTLRVYQAACQGAAYLSRALLEVSSWTENPKDLQSIIPRSLRNVFKNAKTGLEQQWLLTVRDLSRSSLAPERKLALLASLGVFSQADQSENRKISKEGDENEFSRRLATLSALLSLGKEETLDFNFSESKNISDILSNLLTKSLKEDDYLDWKDVDRFAEKYLATWGSTRKPLAWLTYENRLKTIRESSVQEEFGNMIRSVLNGAFLKERYSIEKSPHLRTIQEKNPDLFQNWQRPPIFKPWMPGTQIGSEVLFDFKNFLTRIQADGHLKEGEFKELSLFVDGIAIEKPSKLIQICMQLCENSTSLSKKKVELQELKTLINHQTQFAYDIDDLLKSIEKNKDEKTFDLVDTNDWQDLFLSGTEVLGSCQRIDGDPKLNKCLLAYVMDGKNRMIALKERASGKLEARAMFRLLLDDQDRPTLFLDRGYPQSSKEQKEALLDFAIERAKVLGCTLVVKEHDVVAEPFKGTLHSLGSRAPYEYEDAAQGVMLNGKFKISGLKVLYQSQ